MVKGLRLIGFRVKVQSFRFMGLLVQGSRPIRLWIYYSGFRV